MHYLIQKFYFLCATHYIIFQNILLFFLKHCDLSLVCLPDDVKHLAYRLFWKQVILFKMSIYTDFQII